MGVVVKCHVGLSSDQICRLISIRQYCGVTKAMSDSPQPARTTYALPASVLGSNLAMVAPMEYHPIVQSRAVN